jgi:hypothetical protein
MSGILMAAALVGSAGAAPANPLFTSITLTVGTSFDVSGASGDLYSAAGAYIGIVISGGVAPYGGGHSCVKDGGTGSVFVTGPADGVHDTVGWSGLSIGDSIVFHLSNHATDSAGHTADARYPVSTGAAIAIRRVS